ncbi:hypothetical protein [Leptospira santarosai]|uniref:hypothetical protein n=1 Tax=Leptospira santarosai TaxID=28183 RepID=UPI0024AFFF68|nr:hypothetical protein [Leptospira santarosai]MDI7165932.1 hypothetical protein [Leptospira santarosai]
MSELKEIIKIIERRRTEIASEPNDRARLVNFIRGFVDTKRGNSAMLAKECGLPTSTISRIITQTGPQSSLETIINVTEAVIKLQKLQ